jgi:hypothetical protein
MTPLTQRERRLIALGLLILAVSTVVFGVILPILSGFAERAQERERLVMLYSRNQRMIGGISAWRAQAESQKADHDRFALAAPSLSAASEILKETLSKGLQSQGGEVRAVLDTPADPGWVRVRADASLNLTQMTDSLRQMQNQHPYLIIEAVSIAADEAFSTGRLAPMDVRLEIAAPVPALSTP